jgi:hypothetical protein
MSKVPGVSRRLGVAAARASAAVRTWPGRLAAARRAMSVDRFARAGVRALPAYAAAYGLATLGEPARVNPYQMVIGLIGVWCALVGAVALVLLLGWRRPAVIGMLTAVGGATAQLSLTGAPAGTSVGGVPAGVVALLGVLAHGTGWYVLGREVTRAGRFNRVDGVVLMVAAPMVGPAGALVWPLQTIGAMLLAAGGLGVALTAARPPRQAIASGRMPAWPLSSSPTPTTSGSPTTGP